MIPHFQTNNEIMNSNNNCHKAELLLSRCKKKKKMRAECLPPKMSSAAGAGRAEDAVESVVGAEGVGGVISGTVSGVTVGVVLGSPLAGIAVLPSAGFMAKRSSSGATSTLPSEGAQGSLRGTRGRRRKKRKRKRRRKGC